MKRLIQTLFCIAITVITSSCGDAGSNAPDVPLRPGLVTTIKAYGEIFRSEVTSVDKGIVQWETSWNDQVIAHTKSYLNIFPLYRKEENETVINEVVLSQIDSLFPIEVGNEIAVSGRQTTRDNLEGHPLFVTMHVIAEDTVEIQETTFDVYMIDMTIQIMDPVDTKNVSVTIWFSPELGLNLKTRTQVNGENYWTRVIDIQSPEETERKRRGLGTVALD